MSGKTVLAALAAALTTFLCSCTVMQSTYQRKADEAYALAEQRDELRKNLDALSAENADLKKRQERLAADLAYESGQRENLARDKEELTGILKSRSDALSQTIYELRRKSEELERKSEELEKKVAYLESENERLARAREEQVRKVSSTYENLLEKMKTEIAQGQVAISELKGKLSVKMVDSILFDSGKAEVKAGGGDLLKKVVSILKDVTDKSIRIEGHTDNVQISASLAKRYPTNWELSAARAINVSRFLQAQGIDPAQLSAVAYGEWKPVGDNATPEGRAKNRRIEINLVDRDLE